MTSKVGFASDSMFGSRAGSYSALMTRPRRLLAALRNAFIASWVKAVENLVSNCDSFDTRR
jgi:hypothetical protein